MVDEHAQTVQERPPGIDGRRQQRLADKTRRLRRHERLGEELETAAPLGVGKRIDLRVFRRRFLVRVPSHDNLARLENGWFQRPCGQPAQTGGLQSRLQHGWGLYYDHAPRLVLSRKQHQWNQALLIPRVFRMKMNGFFGLIGYFDDEAAGRPFLREAEPGAVGLVDRLGREQGRQPRR